jgi:5'-nucleotidase
MVMIRPAAAILVLALSMLLCRSAAGLPQPCRPPPLEILLTNDDGYRSPGIEALHEALQGAGHRVTRVAPAGNASGSSLSFSWKPLELIVDAKDPRIVGVAGGQPANAVVLAATTMYPARTGPDLVVSGINDGPNAGSLVALSGTVGAAMAAVLMLDPPVPAFAVSAARIGVEGSPEQVEHITEIADDFAGRLPKLLGWLCRTKDASRFDTVFNINYPAREATAIAGIAVAGLDDLRSIRVSYETSPDTTLRTARVERVRPPKGISSSDVSLLDRGFVTVTPLKPRFAAPESGLQELQHTLEDAGR